MTRTVYGPPVGLAVRGVGVGAVGLGIAIIALSAIVAADLPAWVNGVAIVVLSVAAVSFTVILLVGVLRVFGRGTRLVLNDDGFVNTTGFGLGTRRGSWRDVRKVQTDGAVVSVDLAGGRQSLIRTSALDVESRVLARELRSRLNTDRGYRPLTPPDDQR